MQHGGVQLSGGLSCQTRAIGKPVPGFDVRVIDDAGAPRRQRAISPSAAGRLA